MLLYQRSPSSLKLNISNSGEKKEKKVKIYNYPAPILRQTIEKGICSHWEKAASSVVCCLKPFGQNVPRAHLFLRLLY